MDRNIIDNNKDALTQEVDVKTLEEISETQTPSKNSKKIVKAIENKKVDMTPKKVAIKFNNITKVFGNLKANKDINFEVYENEVHALLGENGAGKSTLMSILFGLYTPTSGSIEIFGETVRIKNPKQANELKIAMLPQHFKLIDNMSVLENIMLGSEITKLGFLNKAEAVEKIELTKEKYNINLDLDANVGNLPVSDKQKVELLKILWVEADIIIFDEPTSILTPREVDQFLVLIKDLKRAGKTILLITHKLPEIKQVADRVSIIRKGRYISTVPSTTSFDELANLMVGKEVDLNLSTIFKENINENLTVLRVRDLSYTGKGYEKSLNKLNFTIKSGEILGIAAIDGNGQSELMKVIGGLMKSDTGLVQISQHDTSNIKSKDLYYTKENYTDADTILRSKKLISKYGYESKYDIIQEEPYNIQLTKAGKISLAKVEELKNKHISYYNESDYYWNRKASLLSHIPEDRHEFGLILDYPALKNVVLQDLKYFSNGVGVLNTKAMKLRLNHIVKKYDVRGVQNYSTKARALSGGNQQKLILGREIERGSNVLLAVHPTRGLDVGAIRNVYEKIIETRNQGTAVLLSSGELDEIMQVSDRIMVLHDGEIVSISDAGQLTKKEIGALMSTGKINAEDSFEEIVKKPQLDAPNPYVYRFGEQKSPDLTKTEEVKEVIKEMIMRDFEETLAKVKAEKEAAKLEREARKKAKIAEAKRKERAIKRAAKKLELEKIAAEAKEKAKANEETVKKAAIKKEEVKNNSVAKKTTTKKVVTKKATTTKKVELRKVEDKKVEVKPTTVATPVKKDEAKKAPVAKKAPAKKKAATKKVATKKATPAKKVETKKVEVKPTTVATPVKKDEAKKAPVDKKAPAKKKAATKKATPAKKVETKKVEAKKAEIKALVSPKPKVEDKKVEAKKTTIPKPVKKADDKPKPVKKNNTRKFIYKADDGKWTISNTKTGKAIKKVDTQADALVIAGSYKSTEAIMLLDHEDTPKTGGGK